MTSKKKWKLNVFPRDSDQLCTDIIHHGQRWRKKCSFLIAIQYHIVERWPSTFPALTFLLSSPLNNYFASSTSISQQVDAISLYIILFTNEHPFNQITVVILFSRDFVSLLEETSIIDRIWFWWTRTYTLVNRIYERKVEMRTAHNTAVWKRVIQSRMKCFIRSEIW